jgi:hypothetical protein
VIESAAPPSIESVYEVLRDQRSISDAREFVELAAREAAPSCREAVAMAVQEFAENLAKYGNWKGPAGTIALQVTADRIRIRVVNVACAPEDGERVRRMIDEINASPSVRDLYCVRHRVLFDNPTLPRVRLGLLRIAFEGGFRLSYVYEHPMLEIIAERP